MRNSERWLCSWRPVIYWLWSGASPLLAFSLFLSFALQTSSFVEATCRQSGPHRRAATNHRRARWRGVRGRSLRVATIGSGSLCLNRPLVRGEKQLGRKEREEKERAAYRESWQCLCASEAGQSISVSWQAENGAQFVASLSGAQHRSGSGMAVYTRLAVCIC